MRKKRFVIVMAVFFLAAPPVAQAQCTAPDAPLFPIAATHTLPPYPELSVMTNEQGTSLLAVTIGTDGVPTDVQIANSSGSLRLDEAARDYVKATWRWNPPTVACKLVTVQTRVSIKWDLRDAQLEAGPLGPNITAAKADYPVGAYARREQGMTDISMILLASGGFVRAKVIKGSGFADLDAKALELAQTRPRWSPAMLDGKPINTAVYVRVLWKPETP